VIGSLEEYVQQVGRAGRDGSRAFCHTLLADDHFLLLRSLAHGDAVDVSQVLGLLIDIFLPPNREWCAASNAPSRGPRVVSVDTWAMGNKHNLRPSVAETLLHYLQSQGLARVSELRDDNRGGGSYPRARSANAKRTFVCDVVSVPRDLRGLASAMATQTQLLEARAVDRLDAGACVVACGWGMGGGRKAFLKRCVGVGWGGGVCAGVCVCGAKRMG
jgi:hypothetical protein